MNEPRTKLNSGPPTEAELDAQLLRDMAMAPAVPITLRALYFEAGELKWVYEMKWTDWAYNGGECLLQRFNPNPFLEPGTCGCPNGASDWHQGYTVPPRGDNDPVADLINSGLYERGVREDFYPDGFVGTDDPVHWCIVPGTEDERDWLRSVTEPDFKLDALFKE